MVIILFLVFLAGKMKQEDKPMSFSHFKKNGISSWNLQICKLLAQ